MSQFAQRTVFKLTGTYGITNKSGVSMYLDDPCHNLHSELYSNSLINMVQTKSGVSMSQDYPCHNLHSELCSNSLVHMVQTNNSIHSRFKMITMNSEPESNTLLTLQNSMSFVFMQSSLHNFVFMPWELSSD